MPLRSPIMLNMGGGKHEIAWKSSNKITSGDFLTLWNKDEENHLVMDSWYGLALHACETTSWGVKQTTATVLVEHSIFQCSPKVWLRITLISAACCLFSLPYTLKEWFMSSRTTDELAGFFCLLVVEEVEKLSENTSYMFIKCSLFPVSHTYHDRVVS